MAKFVVVEDDPGMRAALVRLLAPGNEVHEAGDGVTALEVVRRVRPDIVLLDIYLPKSDGVAVLKELAGAMPETGFLVVTGNEDEEVARECLEFGAFDYIAKPIDSEVLLKTIEGRLRRPNVAGH